MVNIMCMCTNVCYDVMYLCLVWSLLWKPVHVQHLYLDLFIVDLATQHFWSLQYPAVGGL